MAKANGKQAVTAALTVDGTVSASACAAVADAVRTCRADKAAGVTLRDAQRAALEASGTVAADVLAAADGYGYSADEAVRQVVVTAANAADVTAACGTVNAYAVAGGYTGTRGAWLVVTPSGYAAVVADADGARVVQAFNGHGAANKAAAEAVYRTARERTARVMKVTSTPAQVAADLCNLDSVTGTRAGADTLAGRMITRAVAAEAFGL